MVSILNSPMISVVGVRRRSDRPPPSLGVECLSWQIWEDKELLSLISEKIEWESPPSFWLLETLTGLKDQVRRLVA